ncbi:VOC family protein [Variovorax rhizosphaerae]|uniref:VOC family protein n=1 Tax=Variovorax rhizosphaerae TaxID=1836200 RepID=A0ABU8WDI6_9BURK
MSLKLDHIVIAVHDLEATIADYTALGFNVQRGGDHPGRSTHNALVVFADGSYLELIAWKSPAPQERWWQVLQRRGEGLVDFALLPADTAQTVTQAAQRGLTLEGQGPLDGGRLRPDGERLHWQTARPTTQDLPFLCGDITPRALRVPEGDARVHPNGVTGVVSLAIAVKDLDATLTRYRALLGESPGTHVGRGVTLHARRDRIALVALGDSTLVLNATRPTVLSASVDDEHDIDDEGGDPIARRLAAHGEGLFHLTLRTTLANAATPSLGLTHGASIDFERDAAATTNHRLARSAIAEPA